MFVVLESLEILHLGTNLIEVGLILSLAVDFDTGKTLGFAVFLLENSLFND